MGIIAPKKKNKQQNFIRTQTIQRQWHFDEFVLKKSHIQNDDVFPVFYWHWLWNYRLLIRLNNKQFQITRLKNGFIFQITKLKKKKNPIFPFRSKLFVTNSIHRINTNRKEKWAKKKGINRLNPTQCHLWLNARTVQHCAKAPSFALALSVSRISIRNQQVVNHRRTVCLFVSLFLAHSWHSHLNGILYLYSPVKCLHLFCVTQSSHSIVVNHHIAIALALVCVWIILFGIVDRQFSLFATA